MHMNIVTRLGVLLSAAVLSPAVASAQTRIPADPDPTRLVNAPADAEPGDDWQFRISAGLLYSPAFVGSDDYQLRGGPDIEVRYKDRFFLSFRDGAGFDLIKTDHFRAGPVVKFQQQRNEDGGGGIFTIAGARTDALLGLGDVPSTAEAGGYVQYQAGSFSAKAEVRKGIGGHHGVIADLGVRYTTRVMGLEVGERPVVLSVGPRATIVDDTYNQAYFGVTATQSAASGLRQFNAKGGLLSYGAGAALIVPVSGRLSASLSGGYDRLSGDAAKSPLVAERGSRNQATVGLGLSYRFGM
jgi:outer membrane protein